MYGTSKAKPPCQEYLWVRPWLGIWGRKEKLAWDMWGGRGFRFTNGSTLLRRPGSWILDISSATVLEIPAKNFAETWKLCVADSQNNWHKHFIIKGFLLVPLLIAETAVILSEWTIICLFLQHGAQRHTAKNEARISFKLICRLDTTGQSSSQLM